MIAIMGQILLDLRNCNHRSAPPIDIVSIIPVDTDNLIGG